MALLERNSKSAFYKGLSSFWLKYFKDSDQLNSIYAGAESLFGQSYLDLMEIVLSKSLTNIPVFKKEDWKLLVLKEDQLEFDPPVASSHVFPIGVVKFSAIADAIDPALDGISISFVDVAHVREADKEFFPTSGVYNHALSGKSLSTSSWTVVVPSNESIKNAINTSKARIISNKIITALDVGSDAVFKLIYDEDIEIDVTLTAAEQTAFSSAEDVAVLLETKINHPEISVSIEAGYLVIQSSAGPVRVLESNAKCEELLFIQQFNFIVDVIVPLDVEDSLAWEYTYYVQLITAGFKVVGLEYRFSIGDTLLDKTIRHTKFIMNTIYEPSIALEEDRDYRIDNGFIYFTDNPFDLTNVAFRVIEGNKQLAFWMSDVLYDNTLLYDRYGYRFTDPQEASEEYKLFLRGIIFYYTNGPDISSITSALNLVAGIPVILENGEIIKTILPALITTDRHEYEVPPGANAIVTAGQVVNAFDVLTDAFVVEDYIISPNWFANLSVPSSLMPGATLEQRQLREIVPVPLVGDPGYIVGDVDPSALVLTTDEIVPYGAGLVDFELSVDAQFEVEIPSAGIKIPVLVPKEFTATATTIAILADIITKALSQVSGVPFTSLTLDEDATFTVNADVVVIPEAVYATLGDVVTLVNTQLFSTISARVSPDGERILFISPDGDFISITDSSVTAQVFLGIEGVRSFQGIVVTSDENKLVFSNVSAESEALIRIINILNATSVVWAMQPFSSGSGELVGEDGQPNLAYIIFDNILKFNTFKVSFNLLNISAETDLGDLIDIVLKGKPKYVTPIVSPIIEFDDTLEHNTTVIPYGDIESFVPADPSIPEQYDSEINEAIDIVFSVQDQVRTHYDINFEIPDFKILGDPGIDFLFNAGESNFRLDSKDQRVFGRTFHKITIGIKNNLLPEDEALFSFPGVYNYGIQTQGAPYPLTTVERVGLGTQNVGIYAADLTLVEGTYRSEIDPRATHMFYMGTTRPDSIQDLGFGAGDFVEFKFWPDAGNNGKFSILNISYNVDTPNGLADVLWFHNPNAVVDNVPNGKDELDGSSYSFSYKSGNLGKRWFITLPETVTMSEIITELNAAVGDNRSDFPFDISLIGPDAVWGTTSYTTKLTIHDPEEPRAFLGERHQISAEWQRCFHIGGTFIDYIGGGGATPILINPINMLICETVPIDEAILIGFDPVNNIIGNTIKIGDQKLYNGGELSTGEQFEATEGDFVASPIPGYVEYLP